MFIEEEGALALVGLDSLRSWNLRPPSALREILIGNPNRFAEKLELAKKFVDPKAA